MSTQYTPGPWHMEAEMISDFPRSLRIYGSNGLFVADCGVGSGATTRGEADARLIAKAPEMREFIARLARPWGAEGDPLDIEDAARALLAEIDGPEAK